MEIDIVAFNSGDKSEFAKVVEMYRTELFYFARKMVGQIEQAEDIVQDTFLKLHKMKNKKFKSPDGIRNFLYIMVRNESVNWLKHKKIRAAYVNEMRFRNPGYQETKLRIDNIKRVLKGRERLPPTCREIFELYVFKKMSHEQIAEKLNLEIGNVRAQMSIAWKKIKKIM